MREWKKPVVDELAIEFTLTGGQCPFISGFQPSTSGSSGYSGYSGYSDNPGKGKGKGKGKGGK